MIPSGRIILEGAGMFLFADRHALVQNTSSFGV